MKKVVCILTLCFCLILIGCAPSVPAEGGNTPDLNKQVVDDFNPEEDLNAFYSISPYDQLLPREILDGYTLDGYNWDNLLDSSMDKQRNINLHFCNEEGLEFSVSVKKFVADTIPYTYIANPNDPKTYDVEWYSQQGEHYPENYSLGGLFYAKDLTSELIEARMGNFVPGVNPSFAVGVLCGDWQVDYTVYLPNENPEIRPVVAQQTYDMITSALYYTDGSNINSESNHGTSLADLEITQEEHDVLYSITPYDQLLPRKVLSGYVLVDFFVSRIDGVKSGTATYLNDKGIMIEVSMFTYKQDTDVIADPEDPETYNGLFYAKDLTPKLIDARMETFVPGERFNFKVSVLCDNYRVTYRWYPSGEYPEEQPFSAKQMYDMITSSRYFTK